MAVSRYPFCFAFLALLTSGAGLPVVTARADDFQRLAYRNPDLVVDLGVGLWAWPLPLDRDDDGDLDLMVVCPDKPYNGVYFFENPGTERLPVFRPGVRISDGMQNARVSYVEREARVLTPGREWPTFALDGFVGPQTIYDLQNVHPQRVRANQWHYVDYNGDGALDLVVGVGDWTDYGWDNAYDAAGGWTRGPLRGLVYLILNEGTSAEPRYATPALLQIDGAPLEVFGMPSPCFADFDGDGDLDLVCGEFLDGLTYFQNAGTRAVPRYTRGQRPVCNRREVRMDLQMITPTAVDWDGDGHPDLVCGDEDGRVALIRHSGSTDAEGTPVFHHPRYFQQEAADVKFGALVTPCSVDWDGDGDEDLICGNTAGYIGFIENLDGGDPPAWAAPVRLRAGGDVIRIQAGENGSIQGPAEAKWGYTSLTVADWDHDGLLDIVANSIWGKVVWFRNVGSANQAALATAQPVRVAWEGPPPKPAWNWWDPEPEELATQWRTTPVVIDLNDDGRQDLVMLDHEGYLAFYERGRDEEQRLLPGSRIFLDEHGEPLRLNSGEAGRSGRRKLCFADWDLDGRLDLIVNSRSADWLRNIGDDEHPWQFAAPERLGERILAGHTTSPTTVDWNRDGRPDLLVGAEDGFFYYLRNNR